MGRIISYNMENKKCLKSPTRNYREKETIQNYIRSNCSISPAKSDILGPSSRLPCKSNDQFGHDLHHEISPWFSKGTSSMWRPTPKPSTSVVLGLHFNRFLGSPHDLPVSFIFPNQGSHAYQDGCL